MSSLVSIVFIIHIITIFINTVTIWFIQTVQYPLLKKIFLSKSFKSYLSKQLKLVSYFMTPWMILELITSIMLIFFLSKISKTYIVFNTIFLVIIWFSTFFFQLNHINNLKANPSLIDVEALIRSNWVRTLLWSFRLGIGFLMLRESMILLQ